MSSSIMKELIKNKTNVNVSPENKIPFNAIILENTKQGVFFKLTEDQTLDENCVITCGKLLIKDECVFLHTDIKYTLQY